jgi:hypothetical protein
MLTMSTPINQITSMTRTTKMEMKILIKLSNLAWLSGYIYFAPSHTVPTVPQLTESPLESLSARLIDALTSARSTETLGEEATL